MADVPQRGWSLLCIFQISVKTKKVSNFLDPESNFPVFPFCHRNQCFKWANFGSWVNGDLGTLCGSEKSEERVTDQIPEGPEPA